MLPLTGGVAGNLIGPTISKLDVVSLGRHHEDWFDGEGHTRSHLFLASLRVCEVMYEGRHVQTVSDSVAAEVFVDEVAVSACILLDYHPDLIVPHTWFATFNGNIHCFSRYLRQSLNLIWNFYLVSFHHHHC